jgi:hypothetical protein
LALEQEPGRADADFASMGTTIALKNIIGGMQLFVVLVFKDLPQNRFYCSHKLFMQHA